MDVHHLSSIACMACNNNKLLSKQVLDTRQVATNPVQCISRSNDNLVHDIIWLGDEAVLAMGGSDQMVRIVDVESGAKVT